MRSNGVTIAIVIVLVFLVGGFLYWFGLNQGGESDKTQITATPSQGESPTPGGETSDTPTVSQVQIFLIALEDEGETGMEVGCGDSVVSVPQSIPWTKTSLQAAFEELLSYEDEPEYYNALSQSDLTLESAVIEEETAVVRLSGQLQLGGACDNPRVEAQLRETALQFPTVSHAQIFINGERLEEVLSLQ